MEHLFRQPPNAAKLLENKARKRADVGRNPPTLVDLNHWPMRDARSTASDRSHDAGGGRRCSGFFWPHGFKHPMAQKLAFLASSCLRRYLAKFSTVSCNAAYAACAVPRVHVCCVRLVLPGWMRFRNSRV